MLKRLFALVARTYPYEVAAILILTFLFTSIEGVGMGLLLPILEGLQSEAVVEPAHALSRFFVNILSVLHLPATLPVLFAAGLILFLLQALFKFMHTNIVAKTAARVETGLRDDLFATFLKTQLGYFHQHKVGDLSNVMITESHRAATSFINFVSALAAFALVLAYLVIACIISWKLTITACLVVAPMLYFTRHRRELHTKGHDLRRANDTLQSQIIEYLFGMREVKIFRLEELAQKTFHSSAADVGRQNWLLARLTALLTFFYEAGAMGVLFLLVAIAFFVLNIQGSEILVFLAVLFRLRAGVIQWQANRDKFMANVPGLEAVNEILTGAQEKEMAVADGSGTQMEVKCGLEFSNVSFSYGNSKDPALKNIDLRFGNGEVTAIVGESGAGKSTLVDLIVRFHDPSEGQILVGGVDLREIDLRSWREVIGFVSQDTFLFNDTVLMNILYGNLKASEEEVIKAARLAYAHEFIMDLPDGYQTVVGDRGVKLSGGQRQRLALARAIIRNPEILILDEATSDLDSRSEELIQTSLREISRDTTVIIIAHRLSTIQDADQIVVLEDGRVIERGNHQTLLQAGRRFAEYYNIQFRRNVRELQTNEGMITDSDDA